MYNADRQTTFEAPSLKEEDAYPAQAEDGYGWEKLFSERMCRHFREDFGLYTRVARFHNVYGPWGTWCGGREKAPAAICRKVIEAKLGGTYEIEIWGSGVQTRSFMWADDCIKGVQLIMDSEILEPINLGSTEAVSINQLVDIVEDIAGVKLKRSYNLAAPKGVNGRNSDNTLIKKYLNWEPDTSLRVGLEKTYAWIYDQYLAREKGLPGVVSRIVCSRESLVRVVSHPKFTFQLAVRKSRRAPPCATGGLRLRTFIYFAAAAVCGICRTVGARRLEPWNGSIQPGYSGGRALTSSSCLICSAVSLTSTAATLSWSCSMRLAPMMTLVTTGLASSHASEMRAGLQLWALAMGAMTSRIFQVRSLSTMGKSNSERREPSGF